jgi:2-polyprenyl-3-methyl-5-hydroxy-6-metoxy-1,4-benzoquinol methylase
LLLAHAPSSLGNGQALDVGCGVGEFMLILRDLGYTVEAIDGNEEQMKTVCSLGFRGKTAELGNGLPYPDDSFSLVTCLEVIEHVATAQELLEEIQRVLCPGGYLLLSTPNFAFLNNRLHYLRGAPPLNEGVHLRFFTKRGLESLLNRAAFQIVTRNSYGVIPLLSTITTRFFGGDPVLWKVPAEMESLFAYDFIYLSKKSG